MCSNKLNEEQQNTSTDNTTTHTQAHIHKNSQKIAKESRNKNKIRHK